VKTLPNVRAESKPGWRVFTAIVHSQACHGWDGKPVDMLILPHPLGSGAAAGKEAQNGEENHRSNEGQDEGAQNPDRVVNAE